MLDKDYSGLSDLIHPDASVFGTALHEIEYGFLNVKNYYIKSLGYHPKLTVRTKSENGQITIKIEDNGAGIPYDIKDKIMHPFFTTKKGTQGTGLGLSITNDIVQAHGGSMVVHSKPGKTIFTITI